MKIGPYWQLRQFRLFAAAVLVAGYCHCPQLVGFPRSGIKPRAACLLVASGVVGQGQGAGHGPQYASQPGLPGEYQQRLLDMAARVAAVAISHAQEEAALRTSRQRMRDIIEFSAGCDSRHDTNGKGIAWNRAIQEMTGVEAGAMIGRAITNTPCRFWRASSILVDFVASAPGQRTTIIACCR